MIQFGFTDALAYMDDALIDSWFVNSQPTVPSTVVDLARGRWIVTSYIHSQLRFVTIQQYSGRKICNVREIPPCFGLQQSCKVLC